jgi:hypothetical protein
MASNDPFDINNDGKFFLLKTESMSELGSRDGDGNPVTFFLPNNIGVIQSTALLQQLNQNEFKASTPQPNTSLINFLSTGTFETSGLVFARYSWTVDSSDPFKTQQNFANATLNNCVFFKGSTQKSLEVGWDGAFNSSKTNGDKLFSDIIIELSLHISPASTVSLDNASVKEFIEGMLVSNYTEVSGGGDTNLSDVGSNNIIDAINRLISRSTSTRNSMIEDPNAACTFEQIEGKMKNLESSFEAYVGKVFSEGAAQELFNITEKADAYSAIIQNYELISGQSFSGLIDTPTGHISGMYLLSNGSGIIFTGIERIVDDLTNLGFGVTGFTGLHDTPSDYQEGKYLRSTAEGLEYVDIASLSDDLTSDGVGVTGFTGLHDTPTGYLGHGGDYLVVNDGETGIHFTGIEKIAADLTDYGFGGGDSTIPSYTELPDVTENDGKIVSSGCDLYHSCNGTWNKIGGESIPPPAEAPACVNNLEEYNQYQEYKDAFLADNLGNTFDQMLNSNNDISDLVLDVCLFPESSLEEEKNTVVIDETTYKWGMFASPQTINISAQGYSDGQGNDCVFNEWTSSNATFGDFSSANTTVFVDTDLSITGSFECLVAPSQPSCEDVALHVQPAAGETIADKSSNQHTVTTVGDTVADNTATLFGGGTMNFDGNGDYLSIGDTSTFKFLHDGTTDYTVECWWSTSNISNIEPIISSAGYSGTTGFTSYYSTSKQELRAIIAGNSTSFMRDVRLYNWVPELNRWYHVAITFDSTTSVLSLFLDGVRVAQSDETSSLSTSDSNTPLKIGAIYDSAGYSNRDTWSYHNGSIQDVRISKKVVYTANFTPPTNLLTICGLGVTQPSCSEILFHLQSNNDQPIDKSTYQRPIESINNVVSSNDQQLFGGSTFDFTSAQGAIVTEVVDISSSEINGFEAITTEGWVNLNDLGLSQGSSQTIFEFGGIDRLRVNGTTNNPRPIGSLFWERGSSAYFFSTDVSPLNINQWYHFAVVYTESNKTLKVYLDGVQIALIEPISFLLIDGRWRAGGPTGFIKGYLQDFRVSRKEVYTTNFTPPANLLNNPC